MNSSVWAPCQEWRRVGKICVELGTKTALAPLGGFDSEDPLRPMRPVSPPRLVPVSLLVLRYILVLVLAASPLVSSAIAAQDGRWSQVWANPFNGRVQAAEEEEPAGHAEALPLADEAILWAEVWAESAESEPVRAEWHRRLPVPPETGDPTPPPERV